MQHGPMDGKKVITKMYFIKERFESYPHLYCTCIYIECVMLWLVLTLQFKESFSTTGCACKNALGYETSLKYYSLIFFFCYVNLQYLKRDFRHFYRCSLDFPSSRYMATRHWVICTRLFGIVVVSLSRLDCPLIKNYLPVISVD
jgi:hypothetical protein